MRLCPTGPVQWPTVSDDAVVREVFRYFASFLLDILKNKHHPLLLTCNACHQAYDITLTSALFAGAYNVGSQSKLETDIIHCCYVASLSPALTFDL